jgi:hypothetical protein
MIYVFLKAFRDFGGDVAAFPAPWVLPFAGEFLVRKGGFELVHHVDNT